MSKKMALIKNALRMRLQGLQLTRGEALVLEQYVKEELAIRTKQSYNEPPVGPSIADNRVVDLEEMLSQIMREYQLRPMDAAHLSQHFQNLLRERTTIKVASGGTYE